MIRQILRRLWDVLVGSVMIVLSLVFQGLFFLLIAGVCVPLALPSLDMRVSFVGLLVLFNAVSSYEYFRRRKVVAVRGAIAGLSAIHRPDAEHVSAAFFFVPRGLDRIFTGRELAA